MNRYLTALTILVVSVLVLMVAIPVICLVAEKSTITATYDQFDRLVSVQYGDAVITRETECGCQHLGAFKDGLEKGFINKAHLKRQVIQGPEGPDLCDQIALKQLMDEQIDRDRLEPAKVRATGKGSSEAVIPYIGEDEDGGIIALKEKM